MQSRWALPGRASVVKPSSPASGDTLPPPPFPPDPPDPPQTSSPVHFPPLSLTPPKSRAELRRSFLSPQTTDIVMAQAVSDALPLPLSPSTTRSGSQPLSTDSEIGSKAKIGSYGTVPEIQNPNVVSSSETPILPVAVEPTSPKNLNNYKILPPSHNSPLLTNKALQPTIPSQTLFPPPPSQANTTIPPILPSPPCNTTPILPSPPCNPTPILPSPPQNTTHVPTLAEKLRVKGDKTLSRIAPVQMPETGRPRVLIPDSVFQEGANLHKTL